MLRNPSHTSSSAIYRQNCVGHIAAPFGSRPPSHSRLVSVGIRTGRWYIWDWGCGHRRAGKDGQKAAGTGGEIRQRRPPLTRTLTSVPGGGFLDAGVRLHPKVRCPNHRDNKFDAFWFNHSPYCCLCIYGFRCGSMLVVLEGMPVRRRHNM